VLTLAGEAGKAVKYLKDKEFTFREGSSGIRDIIIDAYLVLGLEYMKGKQYYKALETFLQAGIPEEEASGSRSGNRNIQVNYYIGLAHEALGNEKDAIECFTSCTMLEPGSNGYIRYYCGLGNLKLGKTEEASEIFNSLIEEGKERISQAASSGVDFFAKFGAREAENARLSNAYLLMGLGHKGQGNWKQALEYLQKAAYLSTANLYTRIELRDL